MLWRVDTMRKNKNIEAAFNESHPPLLPSTPIIDGFRAPAVETEWTQPKELN